VRNYGSDGSATLDSPDRSKLYTPLSAVAFEQTDGIAACPGSYLGQ